MNGKCFEIGTIQAFLDGETTPEVSLRLTNHVAACDACAQLMSQADEENSVVFSTLERELNALVPTQRLWTRINETLEVEKGRTPIWQKVIVYIRINLANPSIAAAAGILLVLGMSFLILRDTGSVKMVADNTVPTNVTRAPTSEPNQTGTVATTATDPVIPAPQSSIDSVKFSSRPAKELESLARKAGIMAGEREITAQNAVYRTPDADTYIAGEESYVKTISDLKQNVDEQKETVMTPSTRVPYERDMAVVNDSIKRMREVVKKNPRNQAARQVLYASYQDKIDLLNSVAQREELIASLK